MLSFSQFLQIQSQFIAGPGGVMRPFDNVPMGERNGYRGTPQTIFQHATAGSHNRERMQFTDEKGTAYDMQWSYAVPLAYRRSPQGF